MTFRHPNGLWILSAIPVLIALFLLHRKFRNVVLPSNHVWRLLQKMQKSSRLRSRIWQLVMLLLQILAVIMLAMLASQPLFRFGHTEHRIYILDTSASMQMVDSNGTSRFDRAKETILDDASRQASGSLFTLLCTDAAEPLILESTGNRTELGIGLDGIACSWVEQQPDDVLTLCREMLRSLPAATVCFYTDQGNNGTGIEVINVAADEVNAAVVRLTETHAEIGRRFISSVISYSRDAELTLALYVDDMLLSAQNVSCPAGKVVNVPWSLPELAEYTCARVWITQDDALIEDNEAMFFSSKAYEARTAVISSTPLYWQKAFSSLESVSVSLFSPGSAPEEGYDLYLYDDCLPEALPADGFCMMVNPQEPHPETPVTFGDIKNGGYLSGNNTNSLLTDMHCGSIAVHNYRQVTDSADAEKLLFRSSDPVYLRGVTEDGRAWGYLMFDLKESNLPMLPEFILMLKHLVRDICPILCPVSQPEAGVSVALQPMHNFTSLRVTAPDGSLMSLGDTPVFTPALTGLYHLTQYAARGLFESTVQVRIPEVESDSRPHTLSCSLPEASGSDASEYGVAGMSLQVLWAALFLLFVLTEGMVYRHERI